MKPSFDRERPVDSFKKLLRELMKGYKFDVKGLYHMSGEISPLPSEAAVVGKVVEVTIKEYLKRRLMAVNNLYVVPASSDRVYPDFGFDGPLIQPARFALDVKCARVKDDGKSTVSPITIGTFDAEYFRYPEEKVGNIMAPYSTYSAHLCLIALYQYEEATARNIELLVVEKWRVATKKRSSGTRCYIGACQTVNNIKKEKGDFKSEEEFNSYWREKGMDVAKQERWRSKREQREAKPRKKEALPLFDE